MRNIIIYTYTLSNIIRVDIIEEDKTEVYAVPIGSWEMHTAGRLICG
jgi:hypothetical protein